MEVADVMHAISLVGSQVNTMLETDFLYMILLRLYKLLTLLKISIPKKEQAVPILVPKWLIWNPLL